MAQSNLWYLENIDAEGIFCPQKIGQPMDNHKVYNYKKGDHVFTPRQKADTIYFISQGRVKIVSDSPEEKTITKAILGAGEIFGELAMVGEDVRRDYAIAMENAEICQISRASMTELFRERHPIYIFIMNLIGSRAIRMEKRLEALVFKDSRSRIVEFLVDLNEQKGQRAGYEWIVRNFITHQEIANLTATSRQTVTTVLNELKNKNIITFNRKRLLIRDLDLLKDEILAA